jgi:hypothetical protein
MNNERIIVRADGTVARPGIVTDPATRVAKNTANHPDESRRYIVLYTPGGKHWSGRGQQSYHAAEYTVFKVITWYKAANEVGYQVDRLFDFPVRFKPE